MEGSSHLKSILKSHKLSVTECRLHVLNFFFNAEAAVAQRDLESRLNDFDRVTLYRTLNSFLKVGIIHKIPNSEGAASYGICQESQSSTDHTHDHVHFKCTSCGQIQCLDDQPVPPVTLPNGYQIKNVNLIVDGVCIKCG